MEKPLLESLWPTTTKGGGLPTPAPDTSATMRSFILDAVRVTAVSTATAVGSSLGYTLFNTFVGKKHDAQLVASITQKSRADRLRPPVVNTAPLTSYDQKLSVSLQRGDQIPDVYAADLEIARNNLVSVAQSLQNVALTAEADYLDTTGGVAGTIKHQIQGAFGVKTYETMTKDLGNQAWMLKMLAATELAPNSASDQLRWLADMNTKLAELDSKVERLEEIHDQVAGSADVAKAVVNWRNAVASLRSHNFVDRLWHDLSTQPDPARRLTETQAVLNSPQCAETINRAVSMGKIKAEDVAGLKTGRIKVVRLASNVNNAPLFDSSVEEKCTKVTMALLSSGCYTDLARELGKKHNHKMPIGTVPHQPYTWCDFNGQADKFELVLQKEVISRVLNGTLDHRDFAFEFLTGLGFPPPPPPPHRPVNPFVHTPTPRRIQPSETAQLSTAGAPGDPDRDPPGGGSSAASAWKKHGISPWNRGAIAVSGLFMDEQVPKRIQAMLNSTNTTAHAAAIQSAISNSTLSGANITAADIKETVQQFAAEGKLRSHWMMEMLNGFMGSDLTAQASQVFAFAVTWLFLRWVTQRAIESICRRARLPVPPSTMKSDLAKFVYLLSEFVPSGVTYCLLVVLCGMGSMGIGQYLGMLAVVLPIFSIAMTLMRATDGIKTTMKTDGTSSSITTEVKGKHGSITINNKNKNNVLVVLAKDMSPDDVNKWLKGENVASSATAAAITDEKADAITTAAVEHIDELEGKDPFDAARVGEDAASLLMITARSEELVASLEYEVTPITPADKADGNSLMTLLALASA